MRNLTRLTAPVVLCLAAALLVACQSIPTVAPLVPAAGPLVIITVRGGECADGPCGGTTVIERSGRAHTTAPVTKEIGTLSGATLAALDAAVRTTDYEAVRARPFTGECPVAFDGQEFIYEFWAPGGVERIATCETEIDPNHPLFDATSATLAELSNR